MVLAGALAGVDLVGNVGEDGQRCGHRPLRGVVRRRPLGQFLDQQNVSDQGEKKGGGGAAWGVA